MMERFAHVFEAHDRQVLVRKGEDSDENPAINLITEIKGAELSFSIIFETDEELDQAFEKTDVLRQAAEGFAKQLIGAESPMDAWRLLSGK